MAGAMPTEFEAGCAISDGLTVDVIWTSLWTSFGRPLVDVTEALCAVGPALFCAFGTPANVDGAGCRGMSVGRGGESTITAPLVWLEGAACGRGARVVDNEGRLRSCGPATLGFRPSGVSMILAGGDPGGLALSLIARRLRVTPTGSMCGYFFRERRRAGV